MSSNKIITGVLAGVATGAALGFLFFTKKGAKTRKKIAEKGADALNELKDTLEKLTKQAERRFSDAGQKSSTQAEESADDDVIVIKNLKS
jgi:gas vesicle protein